MSKFIKKETTKTTKSKKTSTPKTSKKTTKPVDEPVKEVAKEEEFVYCPKCGWKHKAGTKVCRFCQSKI